MIDSVVEDLNLNYPEVKTLVVFRRMADQFYVMVFDKEYSEKEPRYFLSLPPETFGRIVSFSPGEEYWVGAMTNEQRLDILIEKGFIDS